MVDHPSGDLGAEKRMVDHPSGDVGAGKRMVEPSFGELGADDSGSTSFAAPPELALG